MNCDIKISVVNVVLFWSYYMLCVSGCNWDDRGRFYTFGPNCEFQCNCHHEGNRCDAVTGSCKDDLCKKGWAGPACQYKNFVSEARIEGQPGRSLDNVRDNNDRSCTYQDKPETNPFIRVSIQTAFYVSEINILFRDYTAVAGFSVYAGPDSIRDQTTLCKTDDGSDVTGNHVRIMCSRKMLARYVSIELKGDNKTLDVCEMQITAGRILSYKRPTNSSTSESDSRSSSYAVNGDQGDYFSTLEQSDPWWYVDFGDARDISYIELRTKSDTKRYLVGFRLYMSNTSSLTDGRLVYTNMNTVSNIPDVITVGLEGVIGRFLWVSVRGDLLRLQMKEISVYGSCRKHRCGQDCEDLCYCTDVRRSMEAEYSGECMELCERNWRLYNGFCNTSICGPDRYGYECGYSCNCDGMCDPWTGACIRPGDSCKRFTYGHTCQAVNTIANSASVIQGAGQAYERAPATVDGGVDTCAPVVIGTSPSWLLTFPALTVVTDVLVFMNESNTGQGFEILVLNASTSAACETARLTSGQFLGRCRSTPAEQLVVSTRIGGLQICEVVVLECPQGTFGTFCDQVCRCAGGRACDRVTGICPSGGCESGYKGDTCSTECTLGTYGANCSVTCGLCFGGAHCDIISGDCTTFPCQSGWQGGRCDMECREGLWGEDCSLTCGFCYDGEACDRVTGVCPNGCAQGYRGGNCTTDCEEFTYGFNCNMTCGECLNEESCDAVDGSCIAGCVVGLQPPLCQTDCNHNTWGAECKQACGDCRDNITCNAIVGVCDVGCDPGVYVTLDKPMCNQACPNGLHGYNCTQTCQVGICYGSDLCDKKTGACLEGCLFAGYQEPSCTLECCNGTYGLGCAYKCGACADGTPCNKSTGMCPGECDPGFVGDMCTEKDGALAPASIALLVIGILFLIAGILGVLFALWVYKKGTLPWRAVEMRVKERRDRKEKSRNFSIVSQVFENNINKEDPPKLKRNNSNRSSYKLSESKPRGTVAVDNFWEYVKEHTASRTELTQQFKDLVIGLCHPCETAKKAQNVRKNRYKEIFAYDHTRVKLEELPRDDGNDYINASYISGYNKPHMYIAAQGPTEEFVSDFWRMIWQKQCRKIVMLTRLVEHNKVKCCQYWPDEGRKQYGGVTVEARDADTFSDYTVRTFVISTEKGESRVVKHFQFEAWSDRHVPEYASSVLHFRGCVQGHDSKDNVPTVVHCSAGIGRSGTYLALDYLTEQADVEGYVNVFQCVQNLRHQRVNMVQNLEQYMFLHEALAEVLFCPNAALPADRFAASYQRALEAPAGGKQPRLELEFQRLQHVTKFHESMKSSFYEGEEYRAARAFENTQKNRTKNILPSDLHRPFLTTRVADTNDYINAVFLPSYRESKSFLLTQNPLADTIIDFWRMVYENNVCTIVNMDTISRQYEVYWPMESETVTFIPFQLHYVTEVDHVTHIERTIKLTNAEEPKEKARLIKQYECRFWMSESHVPVGAESSLLAVCDHAAKWQTANGNPPIVAHCQNGATKSGLFCVVMATVERVKQERDVALQQTVKQMRINRHQIIPTYEQYKFIHDVVIDFLRATELLPT